MEKNLNPLFLEESSRTFLKHAKEFNSTKGKNFLKQAIARQKHGKEASKDFSKLNKEIFKPESDKIPLEKIDGYLSSKENLKKGFRAKHGRDPIDLNYNFVGNKGFTLNSKGKKRR